MQLGVAGSYDSRTETIRHVDVPGFGRPGLVPEIAAALGTHVGVDNDVNLAAVAERRRGVGRDADGFALLWLGQEGLGLAIDIGGTLMRGARGGAGEIGYMPLYAPDCPTHRKIDLQDLFGGAAILALGQDTASTGATPPRSCRARRPTTVRRVLHPARRPDRRRPGRGHRRARPVLVVLAGPVAQAGGETLLTAVTAAVRRAAPLESAIAVTAIDDDAVLLGALDAGLTAVRDALITAIRDD